MIVTCNSLPTEHCSQGPGPPGPPGERRAAEKADGLQCAGEEKEMSEEANFLTIRTHHLLLDHLGLLPHAEAPVVLGPLGAVIWLASGRVDGWTSRLGGTSTTSSSTVIVTSTIVVTSSPASASSVGDECLPRESSVTRALGKTIRYRED